MCQQWDLVEFSYEPLSFFTCMEIWDETTSEQGVQVSLCTCSFSSGLKVVSFTSPSLIKAHPLFLSASISQKDAISSENTFHYCSSAPWNVMTHPSNISFVNCQQISVLSLPACALTGPLGSCPYREQHQGCSPGSTPSPDLLSQSSTPRQLNSRTASPLLGKLPLLL